MFLVPSKKKREKEFNYAIGHCDIIYVPLRDVWIAPHLLVCRLTLRRRKLQHARLNASEKTFRIILALTSLPVQKSLHIISLCCHTKFICAAARSSNLTIRAAVSRVALAGKVRSLYIKNKAVHAIVQQCRGIFNKLAYPFVIHTIYTYKLWFVVRRPRYHRNSAHFGCSA